MAQDTLKNKVRFSTTLSPETNNALKEYSKKTMIPISKIVESAIIEYIKRNNKEAI